MHMFYSYDPPFYYPPDFYTHYWRDQQYPDVNPEMLNQSAQASQKLMAEASTVLNELATSKDFSKKLMSAAQQSNSEEVKRLIDSLGVTSDVDIHYNPDGLRLQFKTDVENVHCCTLTIALRWR